MIIIQSGSMFIIVSILHWLLTIAKDCHNEILNWYEISISNCFFWFVLFCFFFISLFFLFSLSKATYIDKLYSQRKTQ